MVKKDFVFPDNIGGFIKWCNSLNKIKIDFRIANAVEKDKAADIPRYWKRNQQTYLKSMKVYETFTDMEKGYVKCIKRHHIPSTELCLLANPYRMYEKWRKIMFKDNNNCLESISKDKVGEAIKEARKMACLTRIEVASLIGIPANTLKAYEDGRSMIPFDTFYLLYQFLDISLKYLH